MLVKCNTFVGHHAFGAMLSEWITGAPGLGVLILESGVMREIEILWGGCAARGAERGEGCYANGC
jgi:hypothetical protein